MNAAKRRVMAQAIFIIATGNCWAQEQELSRDEMDARLPADLETVVAEGKAEGIQNIFWNRMWGAYQKDPQKRVELAVQYTKSKDPLVRFWAEFIIAQTLQSKKDLTAEEHYIRMMADEAAAHAALKRAGSNFADMTDGFYNYWYELFRDAGKKEEAQYILLTACRHFLKEDHWGSTVARMHYQLTVKERGVEDDRMVLRICDAYLENRRRFPFQGVGEVEWINQISERRELLSREIAAEKMPDFSALELIEDTATDMETLRPRMVAAGGSVWIAWCTRQANGPAWQIDPATNAARRIEGVPATQLAVTTLGDSVFFGGNEGIFQVDFKGNLRRHLTEGPEGLPSARIVDLCAVEKKIYFCYFVDSTRYGVGVWNTESDKIRVISPKNADDRTGPIYSPSRLWWNAAEKQLIANSDGDGGVSRTAFVLEGDAWRSSSTYLALSRGTETLALVPTAETTRHPFIGNLATEALLQLTHSKEVTIKLPELNKMPEPAWDAKRIWLPLQRGLYEISRETGEMTWIARQEHTPCLAAVEDQGVVYVATTRGIYRYKPK